MLTPNPRVAKPVDVEGRQVLVVGAGASGVAAARLAVLLGAQVTVVDARPVEQLAAAARSLSGEGVLVLGGVERLEGGPAPDLAVVSPGVPPTAPIMRDLAQRLVPVVGETELAWQYCPAPVAAITGTNGKGTTCRLLAAMLKAAGRPTALAGNIGRPLADCLFELTSEHVVVLEVSSFQLMTTRTFAPQVAAVLNLTPDHLDWHRDLDEYAAAKAGIFTRQWPEDLTLLVTDDAGAAALEPKVVARLARVGLGGEVEVTWRGERIVARLPGRDVQAVDASALAEAGPLRLTPAAGLKLDAMVAAAAALWLGATPEAVAEGLGSYEPAAHLMTLVAERGGVRYVDDSKATNVAAAINDLEQLAVEGSVVVITGGKDKGVDLAPWARALSRTAKAAVLIGETAGRLSDAIWGIPVERAADLDTAIAAAQRHAAPGDAVALLPAASSFDMFADYADRGEKFARAVARALGEEEA